MKLKHILFVIIPILFGAFLSHLVNQYDNAKLLAQFKAELEATHKAKRPSTPEEMIALNNKQQQLEGQISLLEQL